MVYRLDDYKNAYPNRPLAVLNKFQNCNKNLHEMSLDELNDFVKDWKPNDNQRTVDSWKETSLIISSGYRHKDVKQIRQ